MGEALGHFVTQITQFGVIIWEPRRCIQDIPAPPRVFLQELCGEGSEFSTHRWGLAFSTGVQEFLSCSLGMAEPWGMLSTVQVQAGFESGAPNVQRG